VPKLLKSCVSFSTLISNTFKYILPNLIAMGIPSVGLTQQWRNSRTQIAKYLNTHHPNSYMIWNLTEII